MVYLISMEPLSPVIVPHQEEKAFSEVVSLAPDIHGIRFSMPELE